MPEYNLPTILTLLRIASIPLLAIVYYLPWEYSNWLCTGIFIAAAITDWLDGHLARKMELETKFGAFLDPVADKLMVAIILVLIVQTEAKIFLTILPPLLSEEKLLLHRSGNGWPRSGKEIRWLSRI